MSMQALKSLLDRPIAYHRCFERIAGSVSGAVFLSQACFWNERTTSDDGFFYKSAEEWEQETGIPQRSQDRIRKTLRKTGILIERRRSVPARLYFKVNVEALLALLANQDSPSGESRLDKNANQDSPSGESLLLTETTTETTTHRASAAKPAAKRATSWPEGFVLNEKLTQYAKQRGLAAMAVSSEWEHFENHHRAKGSRFVDWERAWYTWVHRAAKGGMNGQTHRESAAERIAREGREQVARVAAAIQADRDRRAGKSVREGFG